MSSIIAVAAYLKQSPSRPAKQIHAYRRRRASLTIAIATTITTTTAAAINFHAGGHRLAQTLAGTYAILTGWRRPFFSGLRGRKATDRLHRI